MCERGGLDQQSHLEGSSGLQVGCCRRLFLVVGKLKKRGGHEATRSEGRRGRVSDWLLDYESRDFLVKISWSCIDRGGALRIEPNRRVNRRVITEASFL